ncbi:MAG: MFS transporter [Deltaproteobacteria bacterium]|nr:MFS transporter [Deltaproteobacteria bacterium]
MTDALLAHSAAFRRRRVFNWFPLGLAYAFLYMGRYSYIPAKDELERLMDNAALGIVGTVGAVVYGVSFLLNGPLTERFGGRRAMLIATMGSALVNLAIGLMLAVGWTQNFLVSYAVLLGVNMYFQSFAAIAIVKVNAAWFHVRERGVFGGIFGIMISSGLFLAYTVSPMAMKWFFKGSPQYYFILPGLLLLVNFLSTLAFVRDTPGEAGLGDFDTGSSDEFDHRGETPSVVSVMRRLLTHRIVLTIALIEFCTGVLRNGVMYWFPSWAKQSGMPQVREWLGVGLFAAGVLGGLAAGWVSDRVFDSRRPPVAGLLYGVMIVLALGLSGCLWVMPPDSTLLPYVVYGLVVLSSVCVIGTHGVLSGTSTADFGGKQATAMAVGIIDGFVYLGVGVQSLCLGYLTKTSWTYWGPFLVPFAVVGFLLALRVWHAKPTRSGSH